MPKSKVVLKGIPASNGIAEGKVKVIKSFSEISKFRNADILVTLETNPQYTAALIKASAVITERGGILSHAAIISRELGIPCVVNVENVTNILKDNFKIIINGDNGEILIKS